METQIESAIEVAWNPTADQGLKQQAFEFLNQLRAEPTAWAVCISLFSRVPRPSDIVRHTALEIINQAIQSQQLDAQNLTALKDALLAYIRQVYGGFDGGGELDRPSVRNKLTQTITYLFELLYGNGWETFFEDFYSLAKLGPQPLAEINVPALMLYLRVLSSVHDEIADMLVPRTTEEQRRNNELKDLVRRRDASKVALSWQEVLSRWREGRDDVMEACLKVISSWVSWIDISLVANEGLLSPLFQLVVRTDDGASQDGEDKVRNAAIETVTEVVGKKMKAPDKIEMIGFLNLGTMVAQLISSPPLQSMRATPQYDVDMAEAVAKLVNTAACEIVKALGPDVTDETTRSRANELLQLYVPWSLRFFSDEYDEVCSVVIPFFNDLLVHFRTELKRKGSLLPEYKAMLAPVLNAIILKMKYDEASSWAGEDEQTDEAEFQELRKRLHVLQQAVAAVDEALYIEVVSNVVANVFDNVAQRGPVNWRDLDAALHEMFLFGEIAVKNGGLYSKGLPTSPAAETLTRMMSSMIQSGVASFSHPAIELQYMEICVRYHAFFEVHPHLIPGVLEDFVRFVHHDHVRVKTRSWYLFQRFVKQLRSQLGNVSQTVIQAISDLLVIKAEPAVQEGGDDSQSLSQGEAPSDAVFNSQLYLFEAIGCISSTSSVPIDKQVLIAQSVSAPLLTDLQKYLPLAKAGNDQAVLQIQYAIMAIGTLARGFADGTPGQGSASSATKSATAVADDFEKCAESILAALEALSSSFGIRTAARFAFSRLIAVLGARILPQLPRWIEGLLSERSSKDEMTTFLRLLEQIIFGFKLEIYSILDALLTPLFQRIFAELAQPISGTDHQIQRTDLRREYLNLLLVIFNHELGSVLVSNANQGNFESVLAAIELFAKDTSDMPTVKLVFTVLIAMCSHWGGPDIAGIVSQGGSSGSRQASTNGTNGATATAAALPGFNRFMIERFSGLCWSLLTDPSFDVRDAQARQVVNEMASLQKTIYAKTGDEFLVYLRQTCFPNLGLVDDSVTETYLTALQTRDIKGFKAFFVQFLQQNGT